MADDNKGILMFGMGILAGALSGLCVALLTAPVSGKEARNKICSKVNGMVEINKPNVTKTKSILYRKLCILNYKLEKKIKKMRECLKAKQMAKAKEMENEVYGV